MVKNVVKPLVKLFRYELAVDIDVTDVEVRLVCIGKRTRVRNERRSPSGGVKSCRYRIGHTKCKLGI